MKKTAALFFIFFVLLLLISNIKVSRSPAASSFMVVSENALASDAGVDILRAGGNAIDAAVAVGYALAVVNPCCGNIGGGGFMTIHFANGKNTFINFREKAPLKANKDMFLDAKKNPIPDISTTGYLAVGVPGTVLGLDTALKKYGTMSRQQVMASAIQLAQGGFILTPYLEKQINKYAKVLAQQPEVAAIFLNHRAGDKLIQTDLANTLKQIADKGSNVFYHGPIAAAIVEASQKHGGILSMQDFANYSVQELTPIICTYRGYTIITAPPPSSGGVTICEMLNILENFSLSKLGYRTAASSKYVVETMRYGFTDRNTKLGDPDFVSNPTQELLSKEYAKEISQKILANQPAPEIIPAAESANTTHYSVLDSKGNAVSVTYTLNGVFGAKVIADHTGFFLNNQMDDFTTKTGVANEFGLLQDDTNAIAAGKRPLSSMSPTIVLKDGRILMITGSPGGPRIITSVLLTILNVLDYGMKIEDAVNTPRFHHQASPDVIYSEPYAFSFMTNKQLENMGYRIEVQQPWSAVESIYIDPNTHEIFGAKDDRRPDGAAIGE